MTLHVLPDRFKPRAAVVGAGAFGRHHLAKYAAISDVELVAVADSSWSAREAAQRQYGVAAYSDWRALKGKVDLVSVCSPAVTHAEIVRGLLESGAHVLVEKPIATTLEEAQGLIGLAEAKGRILTVGHQERFVFARTGLLEFPDAPLSIECVRAGPWTGRGTDIGIALDLMVHDLDLVHRLVPGETAEVYATGRSVRSNFADELTVNLSFEQGCDVKLFASRIAALRERSMRLVYPDGVIEIDFLTRVVRNSTARNLRPLDTSDPLGAAIGDFIASSVRGSAPLVRPEQARRALETALLIEDAAALGIHPSREIRAPLGVALSA